MIETSLYCSKKSLRGLLSGLLNDIFYYYMLKGAELACRRVCVRHRGRSRRTVSVKSDRVQRTEAVSWTIRGRKLMWNEFSEHVQPVGTSVKWFYASQYKQKVYRSAYSGGVLVVRYEP